MEDAPIITDGGLVITPLLGVRGDAIYADLTDGSRRAINSMASRRSAVGGRRQAHPCISIALDGHRRSRDALAGAVLAATSSHAISSSRWRRCSRARTSNISASSASPTRTRRASSSTPPRCSSATSSRATTASKAARAPMSACAIPAAYASGWTTNAHRSASPISWPAQTPSPRPTWSMPAPIPAWRPTISDYVGLVGFATPYGLSASVSGRFDEQTFEIRRTELQGRLFDADLVRSAARYAFIQAQPLYGFPDDRHEMSARRHRPSCTRTGASSVAAPTIWNRHAGQDAVGFAYNDECFTYLMTFSQTPRPRHQG